MKVENVVPADRRWRREDDPGALSSMIWQDNNATAQALRDYVPAQSDWRIAVRYAAVFQRAQGQRRHLSRSRARI